MNSPKELGLVFSSFVAMVFTVLSLPVVAQVLLLKYTLGVCCQLMLWCTDSEQFQLNWDSSFQDGSFL